VDFALPLAGDVCCQFIDGCIVDSWVFSPLVSPRGDWGFASALAGDVST
jgi:hypothetical protein